MSVHRVVAFPLSLALASVAIAVPAEANPTSDEEARLAAQHQLDNDVPLIEATFIGTHNSFNNDDDGYIIPNQMKDMLDQLDAGFRALSYDLYGKSPTNHNVVLCHGDICGSGDTPIDDALDDLDGWLASHPDDVVVVVIEYDLTDSEQDNVADAIDAEIASRAYMPTDFYGTNNGTCQDIPLEQLSKRDILDAGKQVIFTTTKDNGNCPDSGDWRDRVWNVQVTAKTGDYNVTEVLRDEWGVVAEDRSYWGVEFHCAYCSALIPPLNLICYDECESDLEDEYELSGSEIETALENGVHIVGLDFGIEVDRHANAIWSWEENEPSASPGEDCAKQWNDGSWNDSVCTHDRYHACQSVLDGSWELSAWKGTWYEGPEACADMGSEYVYAAPVNARMNAELDDLRQAASLNEVWMNVNDIDTEGDWVVNAVVDRTELDGQQIVAGWDSGMCLNVIGTQSSSNGAGVNSYQCSSVAETWWYDSDDGKIKAFYDPSMCLNVVGHLSIANATDVNLYDCGSVAETWEFWESDNKIHASWAPWMCLNVVGNRSSANGQNVNLYQCSSVTETWVWPQYDQ